MKYKWLKKGFAFFAVFCLAAGMTGCDKGQEVVDTVLEKTNLKEAEEEPEEEQGETVPEVDVAKPELTANLSGSVTYKVGDKAEPLKVEAKTSDGGVITYQWYSSQTNTNGGGTLIEGATQKTYTPSTKEEGTVYYYVVATSTIESSTNGITSETAEVIVTKDGAAEAGEEADAADKAAPEEKKAEEGKAEEKKEENKTEEKKTDSNAQAETGSTKDTGAEKQTKEAAK